MLHRVPTVRTEADHVLGNLDLVCRKRAAVRAQWLRWHYGAVREQVKSVALREGLTVVVVEPGYTTMTCSECGRVWLGQDEDTRRRAYALRTLPKLSGVVCAGNSENKAVFERMECSARRLAQCCRLCRALPAHHSCSRREPPVDTPSLAGDRRKSPLVYLSFDALRFVPGEACRP